jgi:anti-sigma B factor antagonist
MAIEEAELTGSPRPFAEVRVEGEGVVVSLAGELDLSTAGALREVFVLPQVLESPAVRVNLTDVRFLDSSSIGILVVACKRIRSTGGVFSVTCTKAIVLRVLEISGLIDFLDVEAV